MKKDNTIKRLIIELIVISILVVTPPMLLLFVITDVNHRPVTFHLSNLPDGAVYADMLIQIDDRDLALNTYNMNLHNFNENTPIVAFNENGLRSFTFHFRNSRTSMQIERDGNNGIVNFTQSREPGMQFGDRWDNPENIRIVILDQYGYILSITGNILIATFYYSGFGLGEYFTGYLYINISTGEYEIDSEAPYFWEGIAYFIAWVIILSIYYFIQFRVSKKKAS